jgi:lactoylglutathione lyase family protein
MTVCLNHIGVTVPDLDRAVDFYVKALGLYVVVGPTNIVRDESPVGQMCDDIFGTNWVSFRIAHLSTLDGIGVELMQFAATSHEPQPFEYTRPRVQHICFQDPDIEGRVALIVRHGGRQRMSAIREFFPGSKPYRMVYCEDPFGNIVELYTHSYEMTFSPYA